MFVSRKRFECEIERQRQRMDELGIRYWSLEFRHHQLLNHLGLEEKTIEKHVELRAHVKK